MHNECRDFLIATFQRFSPAGRHLVEIGSLNINGSAREYAEARAASYIGIDIKAGPGVDVIGDAVEVLSTWSSRVDMVICTEVLEHHREPETIVQAARKVLKGGGLLVLTAAGHDRKPHSAYGAEHPLPDEYYKNVETDDLRKWLVDAGFRIVELSYLEWPGDVRVIAQVPA